MLTSSEIHFILNQLTKLSFYNEEIKDPLKREKCKNIIYSLSKTTEYKKILNTKILLPENTVINAYNVFKFNKEILNINFKIDIDSKLNLKTHPILFPEMIKILLKAANLYNIYAISANTKKIKIFIKNKNKWPNKIYIKDLLKNTSASINEVDFAIFYEICKKLGFYTKFCLETGVFTINFSTPDSI